MENTKATPKQKWLPGCWIASAYVEKLERLARAETRRTGWQCSTADILLRLIRDAEEPGS